MKVVEDKTPGLTSGTGEVTAVSSSQQSSFASPNPLPAKKKRGPAGNPGLTIALAVIFRFFLVISLDQTVRHLMLGCGVQLQKPRWWRCPPSR